MRGPKDHCHASDKSWNTSHFVYERQRKCVCGAKVLANADTVKLLLKKVRRETFARILLLNLLRSVVVNTFTLLTLHRKVNK